MWFAKTFAIHHEHKVFGTDEGVFQEACSRSLEAPAPCDAEMPARIDESIERSSLQVMTSAVGNYFKSRINSISPFQSPSLV